MDFVSRASAAAAAPASVNRNSPILRASRCSRGLASGLYGLSEPGGIVNLVTKVPLNSPYYSASQDFSSLGLYRTAIDATGPLSSNKAWLYRMNMSYTNDAGAFGFEVHDIHFENIFFAPVIQWNQDDHNWVRLESTYSQDRSASFFPNTPQFNGNLVTIPRNLNHGESSPTLSNGTFNLLTVQKQLGQDWSVQERVGYYRQVRDFIGILSNSFGGNPSPPYLAYSRDFNENEYRQSEFGTYTDFVGHAETYRFQHTILLGGDFHKDVTYSQYTSGFYGSPVDVAYPLTPGFPYIPPYLGVSEGTNYLNTGGSIFRIKSGCLTISRCWRAPVISTFRENGGIGGNPLINANFFAFYYGTSNNKADTQTAVTPRVGLTWQPAPWASIFANYSEGFSPDSGSYLVGNVIAPPEFARESEVGAKVEFYEGRLRATASLYDLTKTNVPQLDTNAADFCPSSGAALPYTCSVLSGEQRSKGVEVDVQGTLLPGWDVILNYTNQDVRLTKSLPGEPTGAPGSKSRACRAISVVFGRPMNSRMEP